MVERLLNGNFEILVTDPDIETSGAQEGANDPANWVITDETNGVGRVESVNIGGSNTAYFNGGGSSNGGQIEQTVNDIPIGKTADFSIDYDEIGSGGDPSALIEILDSSGNVVFSQTATTPGETVTASFTTADTSYTIRITDTSSGGTGSSDLYVDNASFFVPCVGSGTSISTGEGRKKVEDLKVGDYVLTKDRGLQAVRWIGSREVSTEELAKWPKLRPVRIVQGALGAGLPERDLIVSRQHRMFLKSKVAERMFGENEVLVAANKMTVLPGVFIDEEVESVIYYHLLFDHHEVVFAEGTPTESLFTGPEALKSIDPDAREEILTLFPEVAELEYEPAPARFIPLGKEQKQLLNRHLKNNKLFAD